jgi:hypothetical protein
MNNRGKLMIQNTNFKNNIMLQSFCSFHCQNCIFVTIMEKCNDITNIFDHVLLPNFTSYCPQNILHKYWAHFTVVLGSKLVIFHDIISNIKTKVKK